MKLIHLSEGGNVQTIEVGGRRYLFEMHPRFGPSHLNKDLSVKVNQPGERSEFWKAVKLWDKQGRRVEDGVAVWEPEHTVEVSVHLGGRHYLRLNYEPSVQTSVK